MGRPNKSVILKGQTYQICVILNGQTCQIGIILNGQTYQICAILKGQTYQMCQPKRVRGMLAQKGIYSWAVSLLTTVIICGGDYNTVTRNPIALTWLSWWWTVSQELWKDCIAKQYVNEVWGICVDDVMLCTDLRKVTWTVQQWCLIVGTTPR